MEHYNRFLHICVTKENFAHNTSFLQLVESEIQSQILHNYVNYSPKLLANQVLTLIEYIYHFLAAN